MTCKQSYKVQSYELKFVSVRGMTHMLTRHTGYMEISMDPLGKNILE